MMEAMRSSETSVLTRATQRNISENDILHSHRSEKMKSHTEKYFFPARKADNLAAICERTL
jgi:hypothetical protein